MLPAAPAEQVFSPLDEELELVPGRLSPALAEAVALLGATVSYTQARALLERLAGARLSVATMRRHTMVLGAALEALEAGAVDVLEEGKTPPVAGPHRLQLSVDGAMIPLVGGKWAEVRTVAIGELQPDQDGNLRATKLSYFSRLTDHANFTRLATIETHRRGVEQAEQVVAANDGADWIQLFVDLHAPNATRVLDFSHASGYVHAAGHTLADGSCGSWCKDQLTELVEGEPRTVIETLTELSVSLAHNLPARGIVDHSRAYLVKREDQIQYRRFIAEGLPIGSGIVESANKLVVEARCKGAGMHWRPENINAILALRCAYLSDHWETSATLAQEHLRLASIQRRRTARSTRRRTPCQRPPRPKLIVDGRPTDQHPWKRYPAVNRRHAKL